jgi:hypothetical protein
MQKAAKKILKWSIRVVWSLLLLLFLSLTSIYIFLNSNTGRTWLTNKVVSLMRDKLKADVTIGQIEVHFPGTIVLHDVMLKDNRKNTLIRIHNGEIELGYYDALAGRLTFNNVKLADVDFDVRLYKGDTMSTFDMFLNSFKSSDTTRSNKQLELLVKSVDIQHLNFIWENEHQPRINWHGIDWDHINVRNFNGSFTYLDIKGDDISTRIRHLNLRDTSGFVINDLRTFGEFNSKKLELNGFYLKTPHSEIENYIKLSYSDPGSFGYFVDSVNMNVHFYNSRVSFKDIAFFTDNLKNKTDSALVSVDARGTVSSLKFDNADVVFGQHSYVHGRGSMEGLGHDIEETYMSYKLRDARTSREELQAFMPEVEIPEEVDRLGMITMNGSFSGFIYDFVSNAHFKTDLGDIGSDLNIKIKKPETSTYEGKIQLDNFDMGRLTQQDLLGKITMNGQVKGKGFTIASLQAKLLAQMDEFDFKGYRYENLQVDGTFDQKLFNGKLLARDRNLDMDFQGTVDLNNTQKPGFNFVADIRTANLFALNLANDTLSLSTKVDIVTKGIRPDDIEGSVIAYKTKLTRPHKEYTFDSLSLVSIIGNHYRNINLHSDMVDASLTGDFKPTSIPDLLKATADLYMDSDLVNLKYGDIRDQYVDFDIDFQNLELLFGMFHLPVSVKDSGYLKGSIYEKDGKVALNGYLPGFTYENLHFNNISLNGNGQNKRLALNLAVGSFLNKDTILVSNFKLRTVSNSDKFTFNLTGTDQLAQKKASLGGTFDIANNKGILQFNDTSKFSLLDRNWHINSKPIVFYKDTMVEVSNMALTSGNQSVLLSGKYALHSSYPIRAVLENFDLQSLKIVSKEFGNFGGPVNGQILVDHINTKPIIESALFANPIVYKKDTLGILSTTTSYDQATEMLSLDARLENNDQAEMLSANGTIDFAHKQALNILLSLDKTDVKVFEPFLDGFMSNLKGQATAAIKVTGTAADPVIKGNITFNDTYFTLDYLRTRYHFTHSFELGGKIIEFSNLKLLDVDKNVAIVNGRFNLTDINNFSMNLKVSATKFQVLNTTQKDNELYYGKVYATGLTTISGTMDDLSIYSKIKTEKNSVFSMPISKGSTFYGHDFIRFIDKKKYVRATHVNKITGLHFAMDLEATPDALAQIIFDPRIGDIIEARGQGNLHLDINTEGDFEMYGLYTITKGNYRFTAFDVVNKSFALKDGGTISWKGNPYDAYINVQGVYTVRTSLLPLATSDLGLQDKTNYTRSYPVDALLKLNGPLLTPDIKLDFDIREMNTSTVPLTDVQTTVRNIKSDEQETNKQVVSLLMLNQFAPVNQGIGTNNTSSDLLNSSVGDLVSNQVNYWLSKISEDIHVNVDYRKSEEMLFQVSTDVFKQRANVSGSYDVTNNNYNTQFSYKIRPEGDLQGKAFSRSNNNPLYGQNSNTIGVGLSFRREFNTIGDIFRRKGHKKKDREKEKIDKEKAINPVQAPTPIPPKNPADDVKK